MEAVPTSEPVSGSLSARSNADRQVEGGVTGQGLADYELGRALGKGKFATVYRAKRLADNLDVALKRVSVNRMDEKARSKALKEVRLVAALNHPNVVKYHDSFLEGEELIMVLEWAPAGDLKRQIRKAQERGIHFEERIVWKYFAQVADAVAHMHERRIMHRDLKPANVFLTLNGTVKVGDLGLGRELSEHTLEAHSKVGTPLYMSPEVLRGDGYAFSSDVWSTGCLLYELAMLRSPFKSEGLSLYALFQKISRADYPALPEWFSAELRELAARLLSLDASVRPAMSEVASLAAASHCASRTLQESAGADCKEEVHEWRPDLLFAAAQPASGNDEGGDENEGRAEDDVVGETAVAAVAAKGGSSKDGGVNPQRLISRPHRDERVPTERGRHDDGDDVADGHSTAVTTKSFGGVPGAPKPQGRKQHLHEQKSSDEDVPPQAAEEDGDVVTGFGTSSLGGGSGDASNRPSSRATPLGSRSRTQRFENGNGDLDNTPIITHANSAFDTHLFAGGAEQRDERPGSRGAGNIQHRKGNCNDDREGPSMVPGENAPANPMDPRRRSSEGLSANSGGAGDRGDIVAAKDAHLNGELCLAMEICWDKLQIAGYHDARAQRASSSSSSGYGRIDGLTLAPLLRTHFAFPAPSTTTGSTHGAQRRGGTQMMQGPTSAHALFYDLVHASRWCLQRLGFSSLGGYQSDADLELASPLDVSRALLVSLGQAGLPPLLAAEWELTPVSVAKGWGTPVVNLLDFLAGEVLRRAPPSGLWGAPSHHWAKDGSPEEANGQREGDEKDDESFPEDEVEAEVSDEEPEDGVTGWHAQHGGGHDYEGFGSSSSSTSSTSPSSRQRAKNASRLLRSNVTADAWREDALRVEPLLQRRAAEAKVALAGWGGSSDWRVRVEALQRHAVALGLDVPTRDAGTRHRSSAKNGSNEGSSSSGSQLSVKNGSYSSSIFLGADSIEAVRVAGKQLQALVDQLAAGERMLCPSGTTNSSNPHDGDNEASSTVIGIGPGLPSLSAAHRSLRLEYNRLSAQRADTSEGRDALSVTAAELAGACDETETACAEAADASTDLSPLRQLQSALPALVGQCRSMDLRMGILSPHYMRAAGQSNKRPGRSRHHSSEEVDDDDRHLGDQGSVGSRIEGPG